MKRKAHGAEEPKHISVHMLRLRAQRNATIRTHRQLIGDFLVRNRFVGADLAVTQPDDTMRVPGNVLLMRHQNDCVAAIM